MNGKINIPEMLSVEKLRPFEGHPYKVLDNGEMDDLTESVRENGVLSPLIVRPLEGTDEYEVISGHRRLRAAERAGMQSVPAFVYEINRDEAAVLLVDSNLHREHILPSEKAFAYKLKMDALAHRGVTCGQVGHKSRDGISDTDSGRTVQRYIRLTKLIPELLQMMDEGRIAFSVGVELSFLSEQSQRDLLDAIDLSDCTPSYSQAVRLHKADREGLLTDAVIEGIMREEKANQREMFRLPMEQIRKYVPNANPKQAEDFVLKACEYYKNFLIRQRDRDSR